MFLLTSPTCRVSVLVIFGCSFIFTLASKDGYSQNDFPNPKTNFSACGQTEFSYVCDPGISLAKDEVKSLNNIVDSMRSVNSTSSQCNTTTKHEVLVALVPRIKNSSGGFPSTYNEQLQETRSFAEYLRRMAWFLYDSHCKMQAVIVLDKSTNIVWTSKNQYAREIITDKRGMEAAYDAMKHFRASRYYLGLKLMLLRYKNADTHKGAVWCDGGLCKGCRKEGHGEGREGGGEEGGNESSEGCFRKGCCGGCDCDCDCDGAGGDGGGCGGACGGCDGCGGCGGCGG